MGFWRGLASLSLLILGATAMAQSRDDYEGDYSFEAEESPRLTRHEATEAQRRAAEAELERFTSPTLTRFAGEAEFRRYVGAVRAAERARYGWYASARFLRFAQADTEGEVQSDAVEPICPPEDPYCLAEPGDANENILVTGTRISPRNPSITNNQMRNVEEGDIVKQIDHFLLVLQDGRIFVIDTRARGRRLELADRANVYRNPKSDMWYDEMLVFGDRILVTGYSYDEEETELAVFRLDRAGRLSREGVFRLSSNDYYSSNNYATRLIGDSLVTYTPLSVSDMAGAGFRWPIVRRWLPDVEADEEARENRLGRPLLDASAIYRPARTLSAPMVHTVSVCPLGAAAAEELACRTTAFVGPSRVQWYVTDQQVHIWTAEEEDYDFGEDCADAARALANSTPALLYRVPVSGAAPTLIGAWGMPPDQFAMQADGGRFYALLKMGPAGCEDDRESGTRLSFFSVPLGQFSARLGQAPDSAFTRLPEIPGGFVASRFTDRHLVYGGLSNYRRGLPASDRWDDEDRKSPWVKRILAEPRQPAYALPIARPSTVRPLDIRHTVIRAERVGDDIVLTGYRDRGGLIVTMIDLAGAPAVGAQARLRGRYESEGRSHAFNSLVEADGSGLMGLPTVRRIEDSDRAYWRSRASDLSFLAFDREGGLEPIGELSRRFDYADEKPDGEEDEDGVPGYECEVSCVDWYGNSRPIFTDGRIFALSGTEIIEGRVEQGAIREVQRLNIARASVALSQAAASGGSD